jgi:hypothetical protein
MGWGQAKIDLIKLEILYKQNLTYQQLANEFNVTTVAIGFQLKALRKLGRVEYRDVKSKKQVKRGLQRKYVTNPLIIENNRARLIDVPWNYVSETGKTILDLKHNDCRWPCNDGLYCGKMSATGKSYCEDHQKL